MSEFICPKCEYIGKPGRKKRGSGKVEFAMWMLFPLGIPYSLWRMVSKFNVCRHCGNELLIDCKSPIGQKLMAKYNEEPLPELVPQKPIDNKPLPQEAKPPREPRAVPKPDVW